ncbi:MAG: alpha/beta hydrolase [Alphaproteobacteria bacterium]|nr:alpha/beta hydrolase [Alphaproteobacteria bacterium]
MATITSEIILDNPAIAIDHAGEGPLVVFMHGIGGNRSNWSDQVAHFAERFHAVAWDARGYGDSDDYEGPLDFGDFAGDLLRLIDHFGVEKAHLVGLSMGGRIAQDFYARHPERVASLVLVSTFTGFHKFSEADRKKFVDLRKKPLLEGKEPKDIAPVVAKTLVGPNATQAQYDRLVASMAALHKESYIKTVEATTMYDRDAELEAIAVPTQLVFGEYDSLTTKEMGEEMAGRVKGSEYVLIENAGHLINLEQREAFDAAVMDFLTRAA